MPFNNRRMDQEIDISLSLWPEGQELPDRTVMDICTSEEDENHHSTLETVQNPLQPSMRPELPSSTIFTLSKTPTTEHTIESFGVFEDHRVSLCHPFSDIRAPRHFMSSPSPPSEMEDTILGSALTTSNLKLSASPLDSPRTPIGRNIVPNRHRLRLSKVEEGRDLSTLQSTGSLMKKFKNMSIKVAPFRLRGLGGSMSSLARRPSPDLSPLKRKRGTSTGFKLPPFFEEEKANLPRKRNRIEEDDKEEVPEAKRIAKDRGMV